MKPYNLALTNKRIGQDRIFKVVPLGESGRGRTYHYVPARVEEIDRKKEYVITYNSNGTPFISLSREISKGYIAIVSGEGTYTRGTYGTVCIENQFSKNFNLIQMGMGAYGQAGRIGTWYEFLLEIHTLPCVFRIRPSGGSHKLERYWLIFLENEVLEIYDEDYELFEDNFSISLDLDNLTDLSSMDIFKDTHS